MSPRCRAPFGGLLSLSRGGLPTRSGTSLSACRRIRLGSCPTRRKSREETHHRKRTTRPRRRSRQAILAPAAASGAKTQVRKQPRASARLDSDTAGSRSTASACSTTSPSTAASSSTRAAGSRSATARSAAGSTPAPTPELDINHDLGGGTPLPRARPRSAAGSSSTSPLDYDIISADVSGGIKVTGDSPFIQSRNSAGSDSSAEASAFLQLLLVCGVFVGSGGPASLQRRAVPGRHG